MIIEVGTSVNNINANAKRHYARTHRAYRHHSWHYGVPNIMKGKWHARHGKG